MTPPTFPFRSTSGIAFEDDFHGPNVSYLREMSSTAGSHTCDDGQSDMQSFDCYSTLVANNRGDSMNVCQPLPMLPNTPIVRAGFSVAESSTDPRFRPLYNHDLAPGVRANVYRPPSYLHQPQDVLATSHQVTGEGPAPRAHGVYPYLYRPAEQEIRPVQAPPSFTHVPHYRANFQHRQAPANSPAFMRHQTSTHPDHAIGAIGPVIVNYFPVPNPMPAAPFGSFAGSPSMSPHPPPDPPASPADSNSPASNALPTSPIPASVWVAALPVAPC
ncbi:hypothetical protein BU15DRAFT_80041 [Melanogaster broomeanus]|nr:hypothetical protein BU15DRAFT_80041 [Melanogaster broomeanus]